MTAPLPQRVEASTVEPAARREAEVICEGRPVLILHDEDREAVAEALADLFLAALADEEREIAS